MGFTLLEEENSLPKKGFTPISEEQPVKGFTPLEAEQPVPDNFPIVEPTPITDRPSLSFIEQPNPATLGELPAVSQETVPQENSVFPDWINGLLNLSPIESETAKQLAKEEQPLSPGRVPDQVVKDLLSGNTELNPFELSKVLSYFEEGHFEDPKLTQELLTPLLSSEGRREIEEAILVREILDERQAADKNLLLPMGEGTQTFIEGLIKGATFNEVGDAQKFKGNNPEEDKYFSALNRAREKEDNKRRSDNPIQAFSGEAVGSVLPFSAGVKLLRGFRTARGLAPVEATTEGYILEGAKVGGPQAFAYKPEGADDLTATQELTARAMQGGIGIAAGALIDSGVIKLSDFASKTFKAISDKRFAAALKKEADSKGFDSEEEYISSLVEFVETPDGIVVKPRSEISSELPDSNSTSQTWKANNILPDNSLSERPAEPSNNGFESRRNTDETALPDIEGKPEIPAFANEQDLRIKAHNEKAAAQGLTEEQARAFEPEPNNDHLTGFQGRRDRETTLSRAIDYVKETDQPGQYVAMDIINLGGLNNRFGEPGADKIFKDFTRIIEEELSQAGGNVNLFRHGGDEVSGVVLGVNEDVLIKAMGQIKQRASDYVSKNNLGDIPHTKGKKPGTGLNYGIAGIKAERSLDEVLDLAHNRLERTKENDYVDVDVVKEARAKGLDRQTVGEEPVHPQQDEGRGNVRRGGDRTPEGTGQESGKNSASEYERLASVTTNPEIKASLLKQANKLRKPSEAKGGSDGKFKIHSPKGDMPYQSKALPNTKETQLFLPEGSDPKAALKSFGTRVKHIETGTFPTGLQTVKNAADVAHVVAPIRKDAQESFLTVVTDDVGNVLRIAKLHKGDQLQATIDPTLVAGTISNTPNATKAYIAHNHPTGNVKQSEADLQLANKVTDLLNGTGIDLEGSIVVGPGGRVHSNLDTKSSIETADITTTAPRTNTSPVTERKLVGGENKHEPIIDTESGHKALNEIGGNKEGVLLLDADNRPKGFIELSSNELKELRLGESGGSRKLFKAMDETNADAFLVRSDSTAAAGNMNAFAEQTGKRLVDVISNDGKSMRSRPEGIASQSTFYSNPFIPAISQTIQDIGMHPGRSAAAAFTGGTVGATNSDAEVGTAKWWADVVLGATVGISVSQLARATRLLGKGSVIDNSLAHFGRYIESLPLIGRGPTELRNFKSKQRLMQQLLDRQTEEVGAQLLKNFSPAERAMMADLIESRGIVKDLNLIHRQAEALDNHLTFAAERMKELGMLKSDLETGGYLHRYYAKHLGLDKMFKQAKKQSLSGSYSIARGTDDNFELDYLSKGARDIANSIQDVRKKLDRKNVTNESELKNELNRLQKIELAEFTGEQNGKIRSFIFAKDEVARVGSEGHPVVLAHLDKPPSANAPEVPGVKNLSATDRVWFVRGHNEKQALLHRDWTKEERRSWGEIEDAGYRYTRGMSEVSHDLSLATLFDSVSKNSEWVSDVPIQSGRKNKEWIEVPKSKVGKTSPLQKYGNLAGKYVRPDVWNGIQGYGRSVLGQSTAAKIYLGAVNKWKLYKTVYNPVTHLNNTYSNVEMLMMGGYSPNTLAKGLKLMRQGEQNNLWREARDQGLFGTDWSTSLIQSSEGGSNQALNDIAEKLRLQPEIPDAEIVTSTMMDLKHWWLNSANSVRDADTKLKTGLEVAKVVSTPVVKGLKFIKKPFDVAASVSQRAYKFEDEVFKMGVYQAERGKGKTPEQAVTSAQDLFFDYRDVPEAVKIVRDFPIGAPFISYTYFAIPAIARNIAQHPEKVLALVAGYEAWNYGVLSSQGMDPGEYWATERAEEEVSPPWEKGRALWGAKNTIHMPFMESYRLAVGRSHALGNPFMSEAGGREKLPTVPYLTNFWGSSIFGGNPTHALLDVLVNEDWKGKEIYKPGAPNTERAKKIAAYLYQAWTPSNPLTPGSYHQTKILDGMANDARKDKNSLVAPIVDNANGIAEALGLEGFTGVDRMDNEISTRDAVLGSIGIKLRPIRFEQSTDFKASKINKERKLLNDWLKQKIRLNTEGRITDKQLTRYEEKFEEGISILGEKEETTFSASEYLRKIK